VAPRPRSTKNKPYPKRWLWHHGALYYMVPPGEESRWDGKRKFRLGSNDVEAYEEWAKRIHQPNEILATLGQALDRYQAKVVPAKAPATRESNIAAIKKLRETFAALPLADFKPVLAYQYRDIRRDKHGEPAPVAANRELEVLSHVFTKCIEWGAIERHPMIEGKFRKIHNPPRDRAVQDWEMEELQKIKPQRRKGSFRMMQAYARVKYLTGRRRIEILRLRTEHVRDDGVMFTLAKSRQTKIKYKLVKWSDALHAAIAAALEARPVDIGPFVFCKADGSSYLKADGQVADAWDSIWQRFMARVMRETKITERFTDHDIRAKTLTDAKSEQHAQELGGHADPATTRRIYRRALIEKTRPVK
jgi:integrase